MSTPDRRAMLDRGHPEISIRAQCRPLGIARSDVYRPAPANDDEDLALIRRIHALLPLGRSSDNVFIERLWRSLKYEDVYLKGYADGREARAGIAGSIGFYNCASEHPSVYVIEGKEALLVGMRSCGVFWVLPGPLGDRLRS